MADTSPPTVAMPLPVGGRRAASAPAGNGWRIAVLVLLVLLIGFVVYLLLTSDNGGTRPPPPRRRPRPDDPTTRRHHHHVDQHLDEHHDHQHHRATTTSSTTVDDHSEHDVHERAGASGPAGSQTAAPIDGCPTRFDRASVSEPYGGSERQRRRRRRTRLVAAVLALALLVPIVVEHLRRHHQGLTDSAADVRGPRGRPTRVTAPWWRGRVA